MEVQGEEETYLTAYSWSGRGLEFMLTVLLIIATQSQMWVAVWPGV